MTDRFSEYVDCRQESREYVGRTAEMFGLFDAKGREIGYRCSIVAEYWVTVAAGTGVWRRLPQYLDRPTWKVAPHATRNGEDYGAYLKEKICFSKDEAEAVAAKMTAAYRKKMARQFA